MVVGGHKVLYIYSATVRSPVLASEIHRSFHWAIWLSGMSGGFRRSKLEFDSDQA